MGLGCNMNRQIMRSIDGVVRFSVWDDWSKFLERGAPKSGKPA